MGNPQSAQAKAFTIIASPIVWFPTLNAPQKLLVSVRSLSEAQIAVAAGVDLLDIKEPDRGSLGMASPDVILGIAENLGDQIPLSAALGESVDGPVPVLPTQLQYAKFGSAGLIDEENWRQKYLDARTAVQKANPTVSVKWVAVAYVDCERAQSPPLEDMISLAIEENYAGVLFDTYSKQGQSLFDWISPSALEVHLLRIRQAGLFTAVAGSLSLLDIPSVRALSADIVAVRSAACAGQRRTASISLEAIQRLRNELRADTESDLDHCVLQGD